MNLGDTIHGAIQTALDPPPCGGCAGRQETLNRAGDWAGDRLRAALTGQRQAILVRVNHGLGDAVVATVVVRHLARQHAVDVVAPRGHASAFWGTARRAYAWDEQPRGSYAETIDLPLDEPDRCYAGHPSTKAEAALLQLGIQPDPTLCTWRLVPRPIDRQRARECLARLGGGRRVLLIHYQGHSGRSAKDLGEGTIRAVCRRATALGVAPVVLDHQRQSAAAERGLAARLDGDDPVWVGRGLDAATIGALGLEAAACLGIDSGPGHCWSAAGARTIIAWPTAVLHPLHYYAPMPQTVHWLCGEHVAGLRGGIEPGLSFFLRAYRYVWGDPELPEIVEAMLAGGDPAAPVHPTDVAPLGGLWQPVASHSAQPGELAVIVPHLHRADWLRLCLRSLAASHRRPARMIVVLNGAEPAGLDVDNPPIELLRPGANVGVAAAWNLGAAAAGGRDVLLLNDDWCVGPDLLGRLEDHAADVVTVRTAEEAASWSCVRLRRRVLDAVGPFDERFWPGMYEDYDYAERCHLAGVSSGVVRCRDSIHGLHATREDRALPVELRNGIDRAAEVFQAKWGYAPEEARFRAGHPAGTAICV